MKYKYKVSVCIPVYNSEAYLEECIQSLIKQNLEEMELIFVNDGSTDKSSEILNEYKEKSKDIKIVNQENEGLGGARNAAMNIAQGEYIGFVDSDDFVETTMFKKLYENAKKHKADISMCNVQISPSTVTTKRKWFTAYKGGITPEFLNRNTQPWNKIISSKLIRDSKFQFYKKNGDGMLIILLLKANGIVSIDDQLYNYRAGHLSMSTDYKLDSFLISFDSNMEQMKQLKGTKYAKTLKEYFEYRVIYTTVQLLAIAALTGDKAVYKKYSRELAQYDYKDNKYVHTILNGEFSKTRIFAMINILPSYYRVSRLMMRTLKAGGKI